MSYSFYGWEKADVGPVNDRYLFIHNPRELYDALINVWCRYTCAPRMRSKWSENNKTEFFEFFLAAVPQPGIKFTLLHWKQSFTLGTTMKVLFF